jgi:hypothetical protein
MLWARASRDLSRALAYYSTPPPYISPHGRHDNVAVGVETVPGGPRNGPISSFIVIKCRVVFNNV